MTFHGNNPAFDSVTTDQLFDTYHYADPADGTAGIQQIIDDHAPGIGIILDNATYEGGQIDLGDNNAIGMFGPSRFVGGDGARIRLADNQDETLVTGNAAGSCFFRNIRFDGNSANNSSGDAFHAKTMWNSVWFSCDFRDAPRHGLNLDTNGDGNFDDHSTLFCRFNQNGSDGLRAATPASRHYYVNAGNNNRGIHIANGKTSVQIHGAQIYGNTARGINVGDAPRSIITNAQIEGPNTSNIGLDCSARWRHLTLRNIYLVNSFDSAVRFKNFGGAARNSLFENINVIEGVSPSGTQGSGDINTGFEIADPNNDGFDGTRVVNCATYVEDTGFGNAAWDVATPISGLEIEGADGYSNFVSGTTTESDGDTIFMDMDENPVLAKTQIWTESSNRAYATAVSGNQVTIALEDPSGSSVGTSEEINYFSVGSTSPKR